MRKLTVLGTMIATFCLTAPAAFADECVTILGWQAC